MCQGSRRLQISQKGCLVRICRALIYSYMGRPWSRGRNVVESLAVQFSTRPILGQDSRWWSYNLECVCKYEATVKRVRKKALCEWNIWHHMSGIALLMQDGRKHGVKPSKGGHTVWSPSMKGKGICLPQKPQFEFRCWKISTLQMRGTLQWLQSNKSQYNQQPQIKTQRFKCWSY